MFGGTIGIFSENTLILGQPNSCNSRHSLPSVNARASAQPSLGSDFMPTDSLRFASLARTLTNAHVWTNDTNRVNRQKTLGFLDNVVFNMSEQVDGAQSALGS